MARLQFWFDFSCPYAYLASTQIATVANQSNADLVYCPMLLGGLFKEVGAGAGPLPTLSAAKRAHLAHDLARWSAYMGVPLRTPANHPMRTVTALRILLALPSAVWPASIDALFAAYWQQGIDLSDADRIAEVLAPHVPVTTLQLALATHTSEAIKTELRTRTSAAAAQGIFGAPAMIVSDDLHPPSLFWGQDRLGQVAAALAGWHPETRRQGPWRSAGPQPTNNDAQHPGSSRGNATGGQVELFFDVASPFAYLALCQVPALEAAHQCAVQLRPILLGALFREIGQVDVPLFAFPPAKQAYVTAELQRLSHWHDRPFAFPEKFPQRTVTAQRMIVAALAAIPHAAFPLALALAEAMWAHQARIDDEATLAALLARLQLPSDVLAATQAADIKQALFDNTAAAQRLGAFGVPTWVVHRDPHSPQVFWGQDRLPLVMAYLNGDLSPMPPATKQG